MHWKFYQRLAKKKGNSKEAVVAASKLLRVVYWIMKEQREYQHRWSKILSVVGYP